jgi:CheY-like chemotaxis protein
MTERANEPASNRRNGPQEGAAESSKVMDQISLPWLLLIEDDPGDQMLVREIVKATNLEAKLTLVKDGDKAAHCIERWTESNRPDLVLLDLNIPKKDAGEVLEQIRKKDPSVRVAALTGFGLQSDIALEWESRVDGYLVKPIGLDELDRTAERLKALMQSIPSRGTFPKQ